MIIILLLHKPGHQPNDAVRLPGFGNVVTFLSEPTANPSVYNVRAASAKGQSVPAHQGVDKGIIGFSEGRVADSREIRPRYESVLVNTRESLPAPMDTLISIDELSFPTALRQEVIADPTSDHALLEATRTGDQDAFAVLVGRYRNQITSYIYRMTNDYDGAVDLAQETFVRLYRAVDRYQTSHAFSTYIYRIATNLAISELRKRKRRRLISLTGFFQSSDGAESCEFDPADERPLADTELVAAERRTALQRAISTLPEKYRAPLILRDVEGKSYEEISRILQTSEGTIKSRISRARDFLREKMKAYL